MKTNPSIRKRLWSFLLVAVMVMSLVPTTALADAASGRTSGSEISAEDGNSRDEGMAGKTESTSSGDIQSGNNNSGDAGSGGSTSGETYSDGSSKEGQADSSVTGDSLNDGNDDDSLNGTTSGNEDESLLSTLSDVPENETETHSHCICGGHDISGCDGNAIEWTAVSSLDDIKSEGNYYLIAGVSLSSAWQCKYKVNLCLNGQTITGASGSAVIEVVSGGSLTITDCQPTAGSITHADGEKGRGINNKGTLVLWNGSITGNSYSKGSGGGVYNQGAFTMYGGSITNNAASSDGGGVFNYGGTTFTMYGGTIGNNSAANGGGGVYNDSGSTFTMSGGAVTNNTITSTSSSDHGGGLVNMGTFNISGNVLISGNTKNDAADNVYLSNYQKYITVTGSLSGDSRVGITSGSPDSEHEVVKGSADTDIFFSDNSNYALEKTEDGLNLEVVTAHKHCVCGGETAHDDHDASTTWKAVYSLDDIHEDGNYYLKNSVSVSDAWECKYNVKLCLNGQTITGADGKNVIRVLSSASLLITDCSDNGKITHESGATGQCGIVNNGGLVLWKGTISGNNNGVYNNENASFTMNGGSITGNTASDGAGMRNYGTFTINGGSITGNTAGEYGGGVYNCGALTATGGSITGNSAGINGGGVYNKAKGTITVNGTANISGNTGGNLFISNGAVITSGGLSDGASVGIGVSNPEDETLVVSGTTETAGFVSDDLSYELTADSENNGLKLSAHKHCICGGDTSVGDHTSHEEISWTGITSLDDIKRNGNYVLKSDVKIYDEWQCDYNVNLCLNGHDIIRTYHNQVIKVASGKSLNITDCHSGSEAGKITHDTDWAGTGILNYGNLTLWNGSITGNDNGGVVNAGSGATVFKMYGGTISGNSGVYAFANITYGGGVSNFSSTFEMYGGIISDNTAIGEGSAEAYGGGVYNDGNSTFMMTGGSITGNSSSCGGGVYSLGTFKVSGAPVITGNINGTAAENVCLGDGTTIIAESALDSAANIGITGTLGDTVVTGTTDKTGLSSDQAYTLAVNEDKSGLMLKEHTHCVCGKDDCEGEGHDASAEWKSISDFSEITGNGNYVLKSDITLSDTWTCNNNVNLCLNGKNIIGANDNATISVANGANLVITDCHSDDKMGKITHKSGEKGSGINNNGTLILWNGSIAGNYGGKTAGGVNNTGTFYMKGGIITGNSVAENGAGVYNDSRASFNMSAGTISGNTATFNGGGIYNKGSFTMSGGTISGNNSKKGGGVYNYDGTFAMNGGSIEKNNASESGGGVCNSSGTFTMTGGTIGGTDKGNTAGDGGGVYNSNTNNSKVEIKGGNITGNSASNGGGIYNSKNLTVSGGNITGNSASYGGGVNNAENGTFTMTGGNINGNTANDYGGAVRNEGTFNFEDGLISNNTGSLFGGGVYSNGALKMSGGTISGNNSNYGGGIFSTSVYTATLNITGGKIIDNKANSRGGGICCYSNSDFNLSDVEISGNSAGGSGGGVYASLNVGISGKVIITDNTGGGNVFLYQGIISAGTMTEGSIVGITSSNPEDGRGVVSGSTDTTIFVSDNSEYETVVVTGYNKLKLSKVTPHEHCVCGTSSCTDETHGGSLTWTGITSLSQINGKGNYYLKNNVTLTDAWICEYNVNLCLNGNTITGADGKEVISVASNVSLAITDCQATVGKITHPENADGRGITNEGTLTLWKGSITGNALNADFGGGVFNNGTFNMHDGSITGNSVINGELGGGVYNDQGTFTMDGGSINSNTAGIGGGLYNREGSTFTMTGGSISDNTADTLGGGVYNGGTLNISGNANIDGNTGGNVYLPNDKTITVAEGGMTSGASVGITAETPASGATIVTGTTETTGFFSDDNGYVLGVNADNSGLMLIQPPAHNHCICGKEAATETTHTHDTTTSWKALSGTISGELSDGNYYLYDDVTVTTDYFTISGNVNICLNGHSLIGAPGTSVIVVNEGGSLAITDCNSGDKTGKITHTGGATGEGIINYGSLTLWNGSISGNIGEDDVVYNDGTFVMNGGSISNNTSGTGVYNDEEATFIMNDGSITGNKASYVAGVYSQGTFTMNDGSITGNTASYAAGVYNDSDFVMNGGSIAKNTADYFGGGVANTDTFTMKGGSITENTAGYVGGGVYNYGTFAMTGGSITKNKVTESGDEEEGITSGGGGIYNLEDVNLSGTVTITGNTVAGNTNNLCLVNTGSLNPAITADANIANASRVGINAYNPSDGLTVLSGSTSTTVFTSDDTNYMLVDNGSNGLKLSEGTVKITGVTLKNAAGGDEMTDGKKVYDGKAVAYTEGTCTPGVEGVTLTYTWQEKTDGIYNNIEDNVAPSDAGEYQLMVTANKDGSTLATLKLPFVITAKALTVSLTAQDKTYDGSTSATASGSLTGVVGDDKVTVKVSNAAFEYKNVGTDKTVTADISLEGDDAGNYSAAATATAVANITAREVSITGVTVENSKVYDGNNSAVITGDGTIDGKVSSDDLTIIPGTAAYDDKNAGKDKTVTFTGFALDGDDKANYLLKGQPASTTASITEKEISITGATVEPKTYDGDTDATLTNVDFNGLLDGETLTFGTDYTVSNAKYDKANATGSDAASLVTFTVTLGDTLTAKNYKLTDTTGTQAATISKASTSDITEGQSNGIRGEENTYEVPSDWIVNGGAVSVLSVIDESSILDGTPAYDNGKLTYKLKSSATDGQKAEITLKVTSDNYEDYTIKVTVTVSAKEELEITVTAGEYVYNGSAQTPTDIKVSGDKVPVSELVMRYVGVDGTVYDSTDIAPSKAGKYTLTVSIPDTNTRYYGTATCSFEIEPKTLTVSATAKDKTYDGSTSATVSAELNGVVGKDKVTVKVSNAAFNNKNVGTNKKVTADISLEGDDSGNYALKEQSVSTKASITAKEVSITGTAVQETKVYDGSNRATITNNGAIDDKISGDDLTIKAGTARYDNKNAGDDKTVTFTGFALDGTDKDNYKLTGQPASTTASITAKEVSITGTAVQETKVYDGSNSATITNNGTIDGKISSDDLTIKAGTASYDNKNAGNDKTVTFTGFALDGTDKDNYKLTGQPASTTANITKKEISITGTAVQETKVYDGGNSATITNNGTIDGKVSSDDLKVKVGTAAYNDKNAGKDKTVTFTGFALDGDDKANYLLKGQPASTTANITEKEISITGATVEPKTYDGDTDATLTNVDFSGLLDGETLTFGTDYTVSDAKYDKANATGSDAASLVTFTVTLGDTLTAKNYKLTDTTGTQAATISKASTSDITEGQSNGIRGEENTYEVPSDWIVNGGAVSVLSVSDESSILDGTPAYDNGKLTYKLKSSATDGQKAEITLKVTSDNYEDYTIKVTVTVSAKEELEITVTAGEYVYNGSAQTPTDIKVSGDKVPVSELVMRYVGVDGTVYDSTDTAPSKAGKYTLTVSIPDTNTRYYGTATCSFEIEPKTLTVSATAKDKTYDGSTSATVSAELNGVVGKDKVTVKVSNAAFNNKNVGTNKKVTADISLEGDDSGNYALKEQSVKTRAGIEAKEVTITGVKVESSKYYDGSDAATITERGTIDDKVSGDDLTIKAGTARYDSKDVGTGKEVTFTGFWLEGRDAGNYLLKGQPASVKADIIAYIADGTEYSVNSNDWINTDFVITAEKDWQLSLTNTAEGSWVNTLTESQETDKGIITFYVRNKTTGVISEIITELYKIDKTAPVISGADEGKTYCAAVTLTINESHLDKVTVNGAAATLTDDKLILEPAEGEQTVIARDKAGNETGITVTVNDGHTWGEWESNGNGTHTRICKIDPDHTETAECTGGEATCVEQAKCDICGAGYGELDPDNHSDLIHVAAKAPTTTEEGNIEYWYCKGCGKYYRDAETTQEITKEDTVIAKLPPESDDSDDSGSSKGQDSSGSSGESSNQGNSGTSAGSGSSASTGDNSNLMLWLVIMLVCGAGTAGTALSGKKKKRSK